ncbi:MAG TPA: hypothetical protein VEM96_02585 [Pyrinomonadaceae bacterium]|nr:hypothetical protein [Pyrinomonadaceae bacterium]
MANQSELNDWGRPEYKRADLGEMVRGKYAKLSKAKRDKVELEYHRMKPEDFDAAMSQAKRHAPEAIRLSTRSTSKRKSKARKRSTRPKLSLSGTAITSGAVSPIREGKKSHKKKKAA